MLWAEQRNISTVSCWHATTIAKLAFCQRVTEAQNWGLIAMLLEYGSHERQFLSSGLMPYFLQSIRHTRSTTALGDMIFCDLEQIKQILIIAKEEETYHTKRKGVERTKGW